MRCECGTEDGNARTDDVDSCKLFVSNSLRQISVGGITRSRQQFPTLGSPKAEIVAGQVLVKY